MKYLDVKHKILNLLLENLKNDQPQAVDSLTLSVKLQLTIKEVRQVVKMMNKMGIVESDQDGDRVVVTHQGLAYLAEMELSFAA